MDWSKQELEKIEAVMKHLNEIIYITNGPLAIAKDVLEQID